MIDVQGTSLTAEDREIINHPLVGGLILFTRNYQEPEQLLQLNADIRKAAGKPIIIAVDHEGGRVQRFRDGFTKISAMANLWQAANENIELAAKFATASGIVMATEVIASGIDISFAPVLDVNGISDVIGDRAFHNEPAMVSQLAEAFVIGMQQAGMKATAKHFPGHGSVKEDSHIALPVDRRRQQEIFSFDIQPFQQLIAKKLISGVMPAHVIFPDVDASAVGFSSKWLQQILRQQLGFDGVIFSDDLSMAGASVVGGAIERAEAAQQAGCDMLLTCNNRDAAIDVIDRANIKIDKVSQQRIQKMLANGHQLGHWQNLQTNEIWLKAKIEVDKIHEILA